MMRKTKAERAKATAEKVAEATPAYSVAGPFWDTDFETMPLCYKVGGVVVYFDDPATLVSVEDRLGRFVRART